jgi:hypothetical protein
MNAANPTSGAKVTGVVPAHPILTPIALRPRLVPPVAALPSLPLAASRNGSLFADRFNANLHWYLPSFALATDVDPSFAFAASQTGQQANGQPFNVARLSLTLVKQQPAQALQFARANPHAVLREVPLQTLAAVLSSTYTDENGTLQQRSFKASSLLTQGDGSILLVFDGSILGDSVLALYQDLCVFGKAAIALTAGFQCWAQSPPPRVISRPAPIAHPAVPAAAIRRPLPIAAKVPPAHPAPVPPPPIWVEVRQAFSQALSLGLKYAADGYQLRYTVATATTPSRAILGADDLSGFSQSQTQYAELKELGDIGLKYPTLSCAYLAAISKTIVLIPRRYSIMRGKTGCSASCLARLDSAPSSASQCAFDFSFTIAPEVSPIDLNKLAEELAGRPDLSGYQLTFADFLQTKPVSTLLTTFASTVSFAAGADPYTFAVTASVEDAGANAPAVASANLLIVQLCAQSGTDLIGSLSLKLDDGYPDPVLATIDLNFAHTTGSDDILAEFDQEQQVVHVTNQSPLDLQLQSYAVIQDSRLTEMATPTLIPTGGSISLPVPVPVASADHLTFVYDAQLALPAAINGSAATKFLNFHTVDVQNTQYLVALDASGVDFHKVAAIDCSVTFPGLPSITPWQTRLTANDKADSSHLQIPIENAVFALPGTVDLTVTLTDQNANPFSLTVQNDFVANPVMTVLQSQLASLLPPSPSPPVASQPTVAPPAVSPADGSPAGAADAVPPTPSA